MAQPSSPRKLVPHQTNRSNFKGARIARIIDATRPGVRQLRAALTVVGCQSGSHNRQTFADRRPWNRLAPSSLVRSILSEGKSRHYRGTRVARPAHALFVPRVQGYFISRRGILLPASRIVPRRVLSPRVSRGRWCQHRGPNTSDKDGHSVAARRNVSPRAS